MAGVRVGKAGGMWPVWQKGSQAACVPVLPGARKAPGLPSMGILIARMAGALQAGQGELAATIPRRRDAPSPQAHARPIAS